MENGHTNWDFHLKPLFISCFGKVFDTQLLSTIGLIVIVYFQGSQNTRTTPSLKHSYFHILDCNCALIEVDVHDPHTTIYVEGCATPDVALKFHVAITVILSQNSTLWCFWKDPVYLKAFILRVRTWMPVISQKGGEHHVGKCRVRVFVYLFLERVMQFSNSCFSPWRFLYDHGNRCLQVARKSHHHLRNI